MRRWLEDLFWTAGAVYEKSEDAFRQFAQGEKDIDWRETLGMAAVLALLLWLEATILGGVP